jgi:hypothetical protein
MTFYEPEGFKRRPLTNCMKFVLFEQRLKDIFKGERDESPGKR